MGTTPKPTGPTHQTPPPTAPPIPQPIRGITPQAPPMGPTTQPMPTTEPPRIQPLQGLTPQYPPADPTMQHPPPTSPPRHKPLQGLTPGPQPPLLSPLNRKPIHISPNIHFRPPPQNLLLPSLLTLHLPWPRSTPIPQANFIPKHSTPTPMTPPPQWDLLPLQTPLTLTPKNALPHSPSSPQLCLSPPTKILPPRKAP